MSGDFGLLALFPGIVENPPAFSFYRTGIGGSIDQFISSATGEARLVYSLFSGSGQFLDNTRSVDNSFYFSTGRMFFGQGEISTNPTAKGNLNIFWDGVENSGIQAGLVIHDTNQFVGSGKPVSIYRTAHDTDYLEKSSFLARRAELRSNLGGYKTQLLPGPMAYEAVNVFADYTFGNPVTNGANDSLSFDGFGWGRWDGSQNLFTNLALHQDYVEVGHFLQTNVKENLGGLGAFVIRHTSSFPTTHHTSGTTFYSVADHSLQVISSNGQQVQLVPGITGVNQLGVSDGIYSSLSFNTVSPGVQRANIGVEFDGKKAVNNYTGQNYQIRFTSGLPNGFSCEILHGSGAGQGTFTAQSLNLIGPTKTPGKGESSFAQVYGGNVYLTHSRPVDEINLFPRDFSASFSGGAPTGFFQTPTNKSSHRCFDFDSATPASIETEFAVPATWESLDCEIRYVALSGTLFTDTRWNVSAKYETQYAPLDSPFSTPVVFEGQIQDTYEITPATNLLDVAITPSGLLGGYDNKFVKLKITRDASSISDSMNATAKFLGATIRRR